MNKEIAFFDFDGTITTRDSMIEVIRFVKGTGGLLTGLALLSPWLVALKLGLVSRHKAKEKMLAYFFGGMDAEKFRKLCSDFSRDVLPGLIRPAAMETIRSLQSQNVQVVVVSASAVDWVKEWCDLMKIELIATSLETINGKITGKIVGKNCHGEEKVQTIKSLYSLGDYQVIHCYGDTSGDRPMLALANHPFYKPFR